MSSTLKLILLAALVTPLSLYSIDRLMEGLFVSGVEASVATVYLPAAIIVLSLGGFLAYFLYNRVYRGQRDEGAEATAAPAR